MRANRIIVAALLVLVLGGCAYGRIDRVPDEMLAQPEPEGGLVQAILDGNAERTDYILSTSAHLDQRGAGGATPLIAAAMTGANDLAARLLSLGADSTLADDAGKNALAYALEQDNDPLVKLLVEHARQSY